MSSDGDAIHPAPEVLRNLEESDPLLFRPDAIVLVAGQVDPLLRRIVHYEHAPNELLQHLSLCAGGQQPVLKAAQLQNVEHETGFGGKQGANLRSGLRSVGPLGST